jgi:hypothetical protein
MSYGIRRSVGIILACLAVLATVLPPATESRAAPVALTDLPWVRAVTNWPAVGDDPLPRVGASFTDRPLWVGGTLLERGIGVYAPSEIEYVLEGRYEALSVLIGVADDALPAGERGAVRFRIFGDGRELFASDPVPPGEPPQPVRVGLTGVQRLLLRTEPLAPDLAPAYAVWGEPVLIRRGGPPVRPRQDLEQAPARPGPVLQAVEERLFAALAGGAPLLPARVAAQDLPEVGIGVAGGRIGILIERAAEPHPSGEPAWPALALLDTAAQRVLARGLFPAIQTGAGDWLSFAHHAVLASVERAALRDMVLGDGEVLTLRGRLPDEEAQVELRVGAYARRPYVTLQLVVPAAPDGFVVRTLRYFDESSAQAGYGLALPGQRATAYFTDQNRVRRGLIYPDGIVRSDHASPGRPLFLYSENRPVGLVLAPLDATEAAPFFRARQDAPGELAAFTYELPYPAVLPPDRTGEAGGKAMAAHQIVQAPRLLIQPVETNDPRTALAEYRRIMSQLHPPAPLPSWVKLQWGSWYAAGINVTEADVRRQIDYIAQYLADLGPWHIFLDAGWYVSEGREGADWMTVDEEKFPSGIRALVDYAHAHGIRLIMYLSTPYLDNEWRENNWMGLKGIIDVHPDWLIRLGPLPGDDRYDIEGRPAEAYLYDYENPELRAYMEALLQRYFVEYGADGLFIDGLADADRGVLLQRAWRQLDPAAEERARSRPLVPALQILRSIWRTISALNPEVYVQSGATPAYAAPYVHTFIYGDDYPAFTNRYPAGGLLEHLDYGVIQMLVLGERADIGSARAEDPTDPAQRMLLLNWLEAGLALGARTTLSFDLAAMDTRTLAMLRSRLAHYNAFQGGDTRTDSLFGPTYVATTLDGMTYLGLINRETKPKRVQLQLADLGLDPRRTYTLFDASTEHYRTVKDKLELVLPPQSFRLLLLRSTPGVMWTPSSFTQRALPVTRDGRTATRLLVTAYSPEGVPGQMTLACNRPSAVQLDGRLLHPGEYVVSTANHTLKISYSAGYQHLLSVTCEG